MTPRLRTRRKGGLLSVAIFHWSRFGCSEKKISNGGEGCFLIEEIRSGSEEEVKETSSIGTERCIHQRPTVQEAPRMIRLRVGFGTGEIKQSAGRLLEEPFDGTLHFMVGSI